MNKRKQTSLFQQTLTEIMQVYLTVGVLIVLSKQFQQVIISKCIFVK